MKFNFFKNSREKAYVLVSTTPIADCKGCGAPIYIIGLVKNLRDVTIIELGYPDVEFEVSPQTSVKAAKKSIKKLTRKNEHLEVINVKQMAKKTLEEKFIHQDQVFIMVKNKMMNDSIKYLNDKEISRDDFVDYQDLIEASEDFGDINDAHYKYFKEYILTQSDGTPIGDFSESFEQQEDQQ